MVTFDFNYYRFNGRGNRPSMVPSVDQANFMRSRYSVDEGLVDLATERVKHVDIPDLLGQFLLDCWRY